MRKLLKKNLIEDIVWPPYRRWLEIKEDGIDEMVRAVRILICVNGVLKHVNTPDSYLRERCANIGDSVRSLA